VGFEGSDKPALPRALALELVRRGTKPCKRWSVSSRDRSTSTTRDPASPRSSVRCPTASKEARVPDAEDAGGVGRRREGAWANSSARPSDESRRPGSQPVGKEQATDGHSCREHERPLSRGPTVVHAVRSTACAGGSWGLDPRRRGSGPVIETGWLSLQRRTLPGLVPDRGRHCETPDPESVLEQALGGKEAQESTDPTTSPWPG
jgi:hypothetical protein